MSNELTATTEMNPAALAELMGVKPTAPAIGPRISRLSQIQTPIMAMVEMNGKKMNMEALPVGTFALKVSDDVTVYSDTVTIRLFLDREQWTRWFSDTKTMGKSVLADDVRNDLPDNMGGYNLGRPSGYIEDFNALPESTKDLVRAVKRTKVLMGLVTLDEPKNSSGEALTKEYKDVPFICDIKNNNSIKSITSAKRSLENNNLRPFMGNIKLSAITDVLANGNAFAYLNAAALDGMVELGDADYAAGEKFAELVSGVNTKIMDEHYDKRDKGLSDEEADIVGSIVDVEV